jgi:hypothetical protein
LLPIDTPNKNAVYDIGFSQNVIADNMIVGYDRLVGNPAGTVLSLFGLNLPDGCYNIDPISTGISGANSQGYYTVTNNDGAFLHEEGRIYINEIANLIQVTGIQGSTPSEDRSKLDTLNAID